MDEVLTAADAASSRATSGSTSSSSSTTSSSPLPYNLPLLSAFLACALAQFLKLFTTWFKEKRWDSKRMFDSGGMPSSHSATVTALAMSIGLQDGSGSAAFAIAVVLACVVMYDASGIRLHAGRQAEVLNQIVCEFPPEHPLSNVRPLRELLGHTPLQVVAGGLLGCLVSYLMRQKIKKIHRPVSHEINVILGKIKKYENTHATRFFAKIQKSREQNRKNITD